MIPHSHTDAGWWLTFDVYYHGRAKPILYNTYEYLKDKYLVTHSRSSNDDEQFNTDGSLTEEQIATKEYLNTQFSHEKFIWADFAFFIKWWQDLKPDIMVNMKELITRGIFGLEHGGMVQHDEALSDYKSVIMMFDTSLRFIKQHFDKLPKVGMSIDGFGHSSLTPYLFRALGHEAVVVFRMAEELYAGLKERKQYLFTWEGDAKERIRVYRLNAYSIDERFNLDRDAKYGTCFTMENSCAERYLNLHVNNQTFNASVDSENNFSG